MSHSDSTHNFSSFEDILQFAIEKEEEARQFYETWASKVKNQAISTVLLEFAAEEQKHKELLLKVNAGESFITPQGEINDLKLGEFFIEAKVHEKMSYEEALRVAIQREIGAHQLYLYLASNAQREDSKQLFDRLALEEQKHKSRLEALYDEDFLIEN